MNQKRNAVETYSLLFADLIAIIISYVIAILLRYQKFNWVMEPQLHFLVGVLILLFATIFEFMITWNHQLVIRGYLVEASSVIRFNILVVVAVTFTLFIFQVSGTFSRLVLGYFGIVNVIIQLILHQILKHFMKKYYTSEQHTVKVLLLSKAEVMEATITQIREHLELGYEVVGVASVDEWNADNSPYPIVASKENIVDTIRQMAVDEVFINLPGEKKEKVNQFVDELETMGIICHYNLELVSHSIREARVETFCNYSVLTYAVNHIDYRRRLIKRAIDILGGIVGILITAVCFPFIAIAIKINSKGPVIFSQIRIGKNGRRFKIYKFRSMYLDAEQRKKELEEKNEMQGLMFKMENDPRITSVGRFLRKTSLDELPQFYNILRGEMSLVGTRPPTENEFEQYSNYYRRRLSMTPGLTGLWQINGRSNIVDFDDVVKYDLEYIDQWSLGLDIKILCKTIAVVFTGRGSK